MERNPMKLLNSFVSPFAARARVAIYAYALPVEIAPSGQWLENYQKSPDFLKINPIGRVPALLLNDGSALPESSVIVEYLADAFPETGLRPIDAQAASRARLLAHIAEIYLQIPAGPLFAQFFASQRDQQRIESCVTAMTEGVSHLNHFLPDAGLAAGPNITIADCALAPYLFFFAERLVVSLGMDSLIPKYAKVSAYYTRIQANPAVGRVLSEMTTAIAKSPLRNLLPPSDEAPA
jgi:glutathione S-transferase